MEPCWWYDWPESPSEGCRLVSDLGVHPELRHCVNVRNLVVVGHAHSTPTMHKLVCHNLTHHVLTKKNAQMFFFQSNLKLCRSIKWLGFAHLVPCKCEPEVWDIPVIVFDIGHVLVQLGVKGGKLVHIGIVSCRLIRTRYLKIYSQDTVRPSTAESLFLFPGGSDPPLRLGQYTWRRPCFSLVPKATHEVRLRALEGCQSRPRQGSWLAEQNGREWCFPNKWS